MTGTVPADQARNKGSDLRKLLISLLAAPALYRMARPAAATMNCTNTFSNMQFGSIDVLAGLAISTSGIGTISCTGRRRTPSPNSASACEQARTRSAINGT